MAKQPGGREKEETKKDGGEGTRAVYPKDGRCSRQRHSLDVLVSLLPLLIYPIFSHSLVFYLCYDPNDAQAQKMIPVSGRVN